MDDTRLGTIESRFADIIWEHAPLSSGELVRLCQEQLSWKKSTTYTVLKKLCERGLFQNTNGTVTASLSRQEFYSRQSKTYVEEAFSGSLPAFFAAFTKGGSLTREEAAAIRKMIDEAEEG